MKVNSMMFKVVAAVALMTGLARNPAFGAAGDCQSRAESLKPYQAVTLVDEYDPEWKGTTGAGVHYYKITLYRYSECTVWITGGNVETVMLDVNTDWESETTAWFEPPREGTVPEDMQVLCLYSDSWSEEDPAKDVFYVCISGEIGEKTSLYYTPGIKSFSVPGTYDNPLKLTVTDATQTDQRNCIEGEFYYTMRLEADRKYSIRTRGGSSEAPLDLLYDADLEPAERDPAYTNDANNASYLFYPTETKDYTFCISSVSNVLDQLVTLKYRAFPSRRPKAHREVWDETCILSEKNGYSVKMIPGRVVGNTDFYDAVIDESLARVPLKAGDRMVFETSCDKILMPELMMRVYDSEGTVLAENTTLGRGSRNVRAAIEAPADGTYYIGVCVKGLEYWEPRPTEPEVTLFGRYAEEFTGPTDSDAWDPGDDAYTGASLLTAVPATNVSEVIAVSSHGPHVLSGGDWYDWFAIPCRKGQSYAMRAAFDSDQTTDLSLKAKVYYIDGNGVLTKFSDTRGSLSPNAEAEMPLVFTADRNGMFYIRVSVAEGVGLDYPSYVMRVISYRNDEGALGLLRVRTEGVDTTWYLTDDAQGLYPNGAVLAMPAGTGFNVRYSEVGGFVAPDKVKGVQVQSWTATSNVTELVGRYWDTADKKEIPDDTMAGAVIIAPASKEVKEKRTLWAEDPADFFKFTAQDGVYYNFELTDATEDLTVEGLSGDAVFSIIDKTTGETILENVTKCSKRAFPARKYNLKVEHRESPAKDTCYRLRHSAATVGTISFAATDVKVNEGAAYANLTLNRSASDGAVRVNFTTIAGAAEPGKDYYPTNGIIAWAAGDRESKTIRVRLIPELVSHWQESRRFEVKIWPVAEDCQEDDEYPATIVGGDTASVKIKDAEAQDPGMVALTVAPTVLGGEDLTFRVARTGGSDGRVAVTVKTQNGTAVGGTDFDAFYETFVWEEGDATNVYERTIGTEEPATTVDSLGFNFKLVAQNTDDDGKECLIPALAAKKVPVDILNPSKVRLETMSEAAAAKGVAVSQKAGNWWVDATGAYRCDPIPEQSDCKAKFTVDGPGIFMCKPTLCGGVGRLTCTPGDRTAVCVAQTSPGELSITTNFVTYVNAGTFNVSFKLKKTDGDAYVQFEPLEDGLPFKWIPLSAFAPVSPVHKASVESPTALSWKGPEDLSLSDGIWYRVRIGATAKVEKLVNRDLICEPTQEFSCPLPPVYAQPGSTWNWVLEYAYVGAGDPDSPDLEWIAPTSAWTYSVPAGDAPRTVFRPGATDVNGDPIVAGRTIELVEGVYTTFALADENGQETTLRQLSGTLPPGLTLKGEKSKINGTPSRAGDYQVLLQTLVGEKAGTTLAVDFHVAAMGCAAGTFTGALAEDGTAQTNAAARIGRVSVTTAKDGTISAFAKIAGVKYVFTGTRFDGLGDERDDSAVVQKTYKVRLEGETGGHARALELELISSDNVTALQCPAGTARLTLDGALFGVPGEVVYACELVRDCSDSDVVREVMRDMYAGYYTVALVPEGVSPAMGVPCGNGYLTLTVGEDCSVLAAGRLADGTDVSLSTTAQPRGDGGLVVPLGVYGDCWSFGGDILIKHAQTAEGGETVTASVIDSLSALEWNKDGKYSSYDRLGFRIAIRPTGGWYNTVFNLQTYYLNRDFSVEAEQVDGLPEELIPAGYTYTANTMPHDVEMKLEGNAMVPAARVLVPRIDEPELTDLARSVNPWNVKLSFVRETGILTGSFKAKSDDAAGTIATYQHYGILPMYRDANTPLEANVLTAGFYLMPVTSKWTFSLPFNINFTEYQERDWSESAVPVEE